MPNYDGSMSPSASYRPRRNRPVGKWSRSEPSFGKPEPWKITCSCCGKLMTYEEYTYGTWCTKHRKEFDENPEKREGEIFSGTSEPRKIIFADGFGILYDGGKFIKLELKNKKVK